MNALKPDDRTGTHRGGDHPCRPLTAVIYGVDPEEGVSRSPEDRRALPHIASKPSAERFLVRRKAAP